MAAMIDNPFSTHWYFDRPDRVWVDRYDADTQTVRCVNHLTVDLETSRITRANDWAQVHELVAAGVAREVCRGAATFNHVDLFLV